MPLKNSGKKISSSFISSNKRQLSRLKMKLDSIDAESARGTRPQAKTVKANEIQGTSRRKFLER